MITQEEINTRPLVSVKEAAEWCGIPERSFRDALAGELAHMAVAVGRRRYVRSSALLAWAGVNGSSPPEDAETG